MWEETKSQAGSSSPAFTEQEHAHFDSIADPESTAATGIGAQMLVDTVDNISGLEQPELLKQAETGILAGGATELGVAALSGAALSAPVVAAGAAAGGLGYVSGYEAQQGATALLEEVGVDEDVSEGIGSAVGGAVGGGVRAAQHYRHDLEYNSLLCWLV